MTSDGKPYAPERFKDIVKERYLISKHTNTDYSGTARISPTERRLILNYIREDLEKLQEAINKAKSKK